MEEGLGDPRGRVFLGHLLPLHQLVSGSGTSAPSPKPQHCNFLPPPLWTQPRNWCPERLYPCPKLPGAP